MHRIRDCILIVAVLSVFLPPAVPAPAFGGEPDLSVDALITRFDETAASRLFSISEAIAADSPETVESESADIPLPAAIFLLAASLIGFYRRQPIDIDGNRREHTVKAE